MPIYVICDSSIRKTDLADLSRFLKRMEFLRQILKYLKNQGIYNLSKPNSLCFGKISKIPVFSLAGNIVAIFPVFPVQWVPCHWLPAWPTLSPRILPVSVRTGPTHTAHRVSLGLQLPLWFSQGPCLVPGEGPLKRQTAAL